MTETGIFDPFAIVQRAFPSSPALNATVRQNAANFWDAQDKLLGSMEEFVNGWFERRHVGTREALACARQMCGAETPADALREYQKWAIGSFERVMCDGFACQKHLMECGRLCAQPLSQATESALAGATANASRPPSRARAA